MVSKTGRTLPSPLHFDNLDMPPTSPRYLPSKPAAKRQESSSVTLDREVAKERKGIIQKVKDVFARVFQPIFCMIDSCVEFFARKNLEAAVGEYNGWKLDEFDLLIKGRGPERAYYFNTTETFDYKGQRRNALASNVGTAALRYLNVKHNKLLSRNEKNQHELHEAVRKDIQSVNDWVSHQHTRLKGLIPKRREELGALPLFPIKVNLLLVNNYLSLLDREFETDKQLFTKEMEKAYPKD